MTQTENILNPPCRRCPWQCSGYCLKVANRGHARQMTRNGKPCPWGRK